MRSRDAHVSARTIQRTIRPFVLAALLVALALMVFGVLAISQSG